MHPGATARQCAPSRVTRPTKCRLRVARGGSGGNELHVDAKRLRECTQRRGRRVRLPPLDAADLGLVDARDLGELRLRQTLLMTALDELSRQRVVEAQSLELGNRGRTLGLGLGYQLIEEVVKGGRYG